jgi:radical SAM superfamily enzyme with C-terminal helix-hairpin-helix motif
VAVPGERDLGRTVDVAVTDHGYRSVSGVPYPLDLNAASMAELTAIPGVGRDRAGDLMVNRPHDSLPEVDGLGRFASAGRPERAD